MEEYILITWLNDFIFCPASIYYHNIYSNITTSIYAGSPELKGKYAHKSIENKTYSKSKHILMDEYVCSNEYKIYGKIDIYDIKNKELIERKAKVKTIYDGYVFQLYAQYFCLKEMGFSIDKLSIYSLEDNKKYNIELPENNIEMLNKFKLLLSQINNFKLKEFKPKNKEKCKNCTYKNICDRGLNDF